jgi:hypothetical protein
MVDLTIVEQLLGVPARYEPWRVADMAARRKILATWLSSAVARGVALNPGAEEYLARMRRRVAELHAVGQKMARAHQLTLLKGSRIAAFMPEGLLRQSGDVDLVAPDQDSLWRCAVDLRNRYGALLQSVNLMESDAGIHIGVALKWQAEEPFLDKPMGADITTCAFAGDFAGVPVRVTAPPDDDLCGLFAVAEERFQRPYRIKDLLDLLVLAQAAEERLGDRLCDVVCEHAERLSLAPELRQLVRKADGWVPVSQRWQDTAEALKPLAAQEKSLRQPGRPGMYSLLFGFPLDTRRSTEMEMVVHRRPDGNVATTPLGSCLLMDRPVLTAESREEAERFAQLLSTVAS